MNSNSMLQVVTDNDLRGEQVYVFLTAVQDEHMYSAKPAQKCTHVHHASLLCRQLNNVSFQFHNHNRADMNLLENFNIVSLAW